MTHVKSCRCTDGWRISTSWTRSSWILSVSRCQAYLDELTLTSVVQTLNVSMSLDAQAAGRPARSCSQPACAMLQPKLPTCRPASSSSASSAFDVHSRPSEDADSRMFPGDGADDAAGLKKCRAVMSSEWVDEWTRRGAAGLRGSLTT